MIKCKICGHTKKYRLIEHLVKTHKIDVEEYKLKYGPVISEEYHNIVSKKSKEKWKNVDYRNKTNVARNTSWTEDKKTQQSDILKKYYDNGGKVWCDGLTKESHSSLVSTGEKNRKNLTGRTMETHPYLKNISDIMKIKSRELWEVGGACRVYFDNKENFNKWRNKISNSISQRYKDGTFPFSHNNFKTGYYKGIFYHSGWELEVMEFLDSVNTIKSWQTNFDVVEYVDKNGKTHRYLPDFKIVFNNGDILILEVKGYPDKNIQEKIIYAKKKYKHYIVCYSVEEVKEKLYEIINNKKHNKIKK